MFCCKDVDRQKGLWSPFPLAFLNEDFRLNLYRSRHRDISPRSNSQSTTCGLWWGLSAYDQWMFLHASPTCRLPSHLRILEFWIPGRLVSLVSHLRFLGLATLECILHCCDLYLGFFCSRSASGRLSMYSRCCLQVVRFDRLVVRTSFYLAQSWAFRPVEPDRIGAFEVSDSTKARPT